MDKTNMTKAVEQSNNTIDFGKTKYQVVLATSMGDITINFFPDSAPNHAKNMISLAKNGFYDGLVFHRVIDGFVIQGGCPHGTGTGGPGYKVKQEFNERKHVAGTLSMARAQDPDSAGSQFFLCLKEVPFLDRQYTVFGETADEASREVVLKIGKVKTKPGDRPVEDVTIHSAKVVESPL